MAVGQEFQFGEFFVATMEPGIEAAGTFGRIGERWRDDQTIGLNRAVDFRDVTADNETGGVGP